ncbi:MAG: glycosyltransferase, partial [Deltaproteobacteria bacterium]|nr:glycosyltransferase [Deltaproteobacteria bacterium]
MVPQITVIIPAYNEKAKIHRDLDAWTRFLHDEHSAELIVVDDGSQDGTFAAVEKYVNSYHGNCSVRLCAYSKNRGKGYAVRYGVTQAKGEVVAFADAGLCVPAPQLNGGLEKLKQGYDYAIASRRHQETKVVCSQPLYRQLGSRAFSSVVR